jgi:hypothetical protein
LINSKIRKKTGKQPDFRQALSIAGKKQEKKCTATIILMIFAG